MTDCLVPKANGSCISLCTRAWWFDGRHNVACCTQAAVTLMLHLHFDISPSVKYAAHISLWKWIICGEKTHKKALGSLICWHYWKCLNRTHRQSCSALQCFDCKTKRLTNFLLCTKMVCSLVSTLNLTTSPSWLRYSSSLPGWWDRRQEEKS